ncbi:MAG: DegT/DnrJ/EryC1/StrS family aminotransferase, partial [Peptococcaceae bacterium]|nr:DegT/DnrJ/EryC1/StrS family aminotransferase [Peptococcaceae bacterium]
IEDEDIAAVEQVLRNGPLDDGPKVAEFEREFAAYVGARYAVAVSSGAAGLHIAAAAAGIAHREEVITSPIAPLAAACCALYQGAAAVFADIDIHTYNMDPAEVEVKISPLTRAIVAVHFAGQPCDLDAIHLLAGKHGLAVIEDATCALGAEYKGKRVGALSDLTVFSFHHPGGVAVGEGGMVTTDSEELYGWLKLFRNNGIVTEPEMMTRYEGPWYFEMQELGYSYRMPEAAAALGITQLKKADKFLRRREEIASFYNESFRGIRTLTIPGVLEGVRPAWQMYVLGLRLERLKADRLEIFNALRAENIGVEVHYPPLFRHPYFIWQGHKDICTLEGSLCPRAEDLYQTFISLPIFPAMSRRDAEDVVEAVMKVVAYYSL